MENLESKNCAFQYWNGFKMVEDKIEITLKEAKSLFNHHYNNMVEQVEKGHDIEVAIWVDMKTPVNYNKTFIHICNPRVHEGRLTELIYHNKFPLDDES